MSLDSVYPILAAIISHIVAQALKIVTDWMKTGRFHLHSLIASGGFPSSHTATVCALALSIGLVEGFDSSLFAISFVFAFITMYDAMNVRYYAGKNIQLTKQLIDDLQQKEVPLSDAPIYDTKMKEVLGHKVIEVAAGALLGGVVSLILFTIFY